MDLQKILSDHAAWLNDPTTGKRCDLSGLILIRANLRACNLSGSNLSGSNLSGADLSGAYLSGSDLRWCDLRWCDLFGYNLCGCDLRGADLRCTGNMREIKTLQIERWEIGYTSDTLQIGCERHAVSKWRKWDTPAGRKWIAKMDLEASRWAERLLPLVLQIIDASPAVPTGKEKTDE